MIGLGHLLPGAARLGADSGLNETYRGIVETKAERLTAYVKFCPGKELANELFASVLARMSGLQVPRAFLVKVTAAEYSHSNYLKAHALTEALAFATEAIAGDTVLRRVNFNCTAASALFFQKWKEWADTASFDDWVANSDRNLGNLLIGKAGEVWLIDHGRAFMGEAWTATSLDPTVLTLNKLCIWANSALGLSEKFVAHAQSVKASKVFAGVNCDIALATSRADTLLSTGDHVALSAFVMSRAKSVHDRIGKLLGVPALNLGTSSP